MHLLEISVSAEAMHLLKEEQDLCSFSASLSCTVHKKTTNNKKNQQIKQKELSQMAQLLEYLRTALIKLQDFDYKIRQKGKC